MIYAVFIIIPVFIAFYYSFTDYSGLGKASFVGLKNYIAMFHDKLFLIALKNTFLVLLFSVIFLLVGSFMAALLMNMDFRGNAFFKMVIFAPYVIAPIIIGIIWGYILNPNYGLASNVVVCGGVTIGEGCVIGAGSVVTRDIPAYSLAAGNPCRVIRKISEKDRMTV